MLVIIILAILAGCARSEPPVCHRHRPLANRHASDLGRLAARFRSIPAWGASQRYPTALCGAARRRQAFHPSSSMHRLPHSYGDAVRCRPPGILNFDAILKNPRPTLTGFDVRGCDLRWETPALSLNNPDHYTTFSTMAGRRQSIRSSRFRKRPC